MRDCIRKTMPDYMREIMPDYQQRTIIMPYTVVVRVMNNHNDNPFACECRHVNDCNKNWMWVTECQERWHVLFIFNNKNHKIIEFEEWHDIFAKCIKFKGEKDRWGNLTAVGIDGHGLVLRHEHLKNTHLLDDVLFKYDGKQYTYKALAAIEAI